MLEIQEQGQDAPRHKGQGAGPLTCGAERISCLLILACPLDDILFLSLRFCLAESGEVILLNEQDDGTRQLGVE